MSIYPWGETTPLTQQTFNLADSAAVRGGALVFTERGTPPVRRTPSRTTGPPRSAAAWRPARRATGAGFRGPQDPAVICPASGPNAAGARPLRRHRLRQGQGRRAALPRRPPGRRARPPCGSASRAPSPAPATRAPSWRGCCATPPARCARQDRASARRSRATRGSSLPGDRAARSAASSGASRTSPTPCRRRATSRSARSTRARTTRRREGTLRPRALPGRRLAGLPVAVRHRRRVHGVRVASRSASSSRSRSTCARCARRQLDHQRRLAARSSTR